MKQVQRKTTPKVRDGKVQKKHRHDQTPNYWNTAQRIPTFDKKKPARGRKHYLRKAHIVQFIHILPDWDELSRDLNAVVLAEGGDGRGGWFYDGVIGISAWHRDSRIAMDCSFFKDHADIFDRLGVDSEKHTDYYVCHFSDSQVRAYQLLHIFLHELGHHHDRNFDSGERYAEEYARKYEANIWNQYLKEFELESL